MNVSVTMPAWALIASTAALMLVSYLVGAEKLRIGRMTRGLDRSSSGAALGISWSSARPDGRKAAKEPVAGSGNSDELAVGERKPGVDGDGRSETATVVQLPIRKTAGLDR